MPAAKPRAKVTLTAKTIAAIEDKLRDAMVESAIINLVVDPKVKKSKKKAAVKLDPVTVARFTELLRKGLVTSSAINLNEAAAADQQTSIVKTPPKSAPPRKKVR